MDIIGLTAISIDGYNRDDLSQRCLKRKQISLIRDLRRYSTQTTIRLVIGGVLLIFLVGDGLVYLFYGPNAALGGLICLVIGMAPLILIWLALGIIDWISRKADQG